MNRMASPSPDDSASQLVSEPLSGVSGFQSGLSEDVLVQAMRTLQAVSSVGYDASIVQTLSDSPKSLKMYFDRVDKARESSVKRINGVVHAMVRKASPHGSTLSGATAPRIDYAGRPYVSYVSNLSKPLEEHWPAPGSSSSSEVQPPFRPTGPWVGNGTGSSTSGSRVASPLPLRRRARSSPADGYCYLDLVKRDCVDRAICLREWPTLGSLLSCPSSWFDFTELWNWRLKGTGSRVHVVSRNGRRSTRALGDAFGQLAVVAEAGGGLWPSTSLGAALAGLGSSYRGYTCPLTASTLVGGTPGGVGEGLIRKAVVDFLVADCHAVGASRSHLWEAVQLAGNAVVEVDGRSLLSGNKLLGMVGDSALKLALLGRASSMRIQDAQTVVSEVLSNETLGRVGRQLGVQSALQGTLQGSASAYVLATAVEALAGACYYGGGMRSVDAFLLKVMEFSGMSTRHPTVYGADPYYGGG